MLSSTFRLPQQHNDTRRLIWFIRVLSTSIIFTFGLIITSIVSAAPTSQPIVVSNQPIVQNIQQWWMPILTPILAGLGTLLAAFVAALISRLIKVLELKYQINVPAVVEQLLVDKAKQLVAAVEEEAENRLLHGDGQVTPGAEKSKQVVTALLTFADSLGYGKVYQEEQAKQLADAALHLTRTDNAAVVGSKGERRKLLLTKASHQNAS